MEKKITIIEPKKDSAVTDNNILKVCAYCRVSTDEDDQRNSLVSQKRFFNNLLSKHPNWTNVGIFADEGLSGTSLKKREQFTKMISIALNKGTDLILTKEVSRFSRNVLDLLEIVEKLRNKGVYVIFLSDNINTENDNYRERLTQIATNAESESFRTSMRVKWGQQQQMENGVVFGRKEMFGYNIIKDNKGIQHFNIVEEEAKTIRKIFEWFAAGDGTFKIIRRLENMGIKTKYYKNGWSSTVILRILRNEKYVGDLHQGKTYTTDPLSHKKKYNTGQSYSCYIENHHSESAIVDRETWNKVQNFLKEKKPEPEIRAKHSNRYWCSGKIFCGLCGRKYISYQKKQKNSQYKTWICSEYHRHGRMKTSQTVCCETISVGCNNNRVNEKILQLAVHDILQIFLFSDVDSIIKLIVESSNYTETNENNSNRIKALSLQLDNAKSDLAKLTLKYAQAESIINQYSYSITSGELNKKIRLLEAEISGLNKKKDFTEQNNSAKSSYIKRILLSDRFLSPDLYERLIKSITVYPNNILKINLTFMEKPILLQYGASGKGNTYNSTFLILNKK